MGKKGVQLSYDILFAVIWQLWDIKNNIIF